MRGRSGVPKNKNKNQTGKGQHRVNNVVRSVLVSMGIEGICIESICIEGIMRYFEEEM